MLTSGNTIQNQTVRMIIDTLKKSIIRPLEDHLMICELFEH